MKIKTVFTALAIGLAAALAGCSTDGASMMFSNPYTMKRDAGYQIPSIPQSKIPEQYRRKVVTYFSKEAAGTIVISSGSYSLTIANNIARVVKSRRTTCALSPAKLLGDRTS